MNLLSLYGLYFFVFIDRTSKRVVKRDREREREDVKNHRSREMISVQAASIEQPNQNKIV